MHNTFVSLLNYILKNRYKIYLYTSIFSIVMILNSLFYLYLKFVSLTFNHNTLLDLLLLVLYNLIIYLAILNIIKKYLSKKYSLISKDIIKILNQYKNGNRYIYSVEDEDFNEIVKLIVQLLQKKDNVYINEFDDRIFEIITVLISAMEDKDPYTKGHSERVAKYSYLIGEKLGLDQDNLKILNQAAVVHDIGKIGIPINIIEKKEKLDEKEQIIMQSHPIRGMKILSSVEYLHKLASIVLYHHERYDGNGYYNLPGNKIPLLSKIISVADTIDSMISDRPYRKALSIEKVKEELIKNKGTQFDPAIVDAALEVLDEYKYLFS